MSVANQTIEEAKVKAASMGLEIKLPADNELFIDVDTEADMDVFASGGSILASLVKSYSVRTSKSGLPHRHITVTLTRPVTNLERVLLQAVMGSDRKREALSFRAALEGNPHPSVFFEKGSEA